VLDLTLLAPDIQERILSAEAGRISERTLRPISGLDDWSRQRQVLAEYHDP
jgi:hypothetical protein